MRPAAAKASDFGREPAPPLQPDARSTDAKSRVDFKLSLGSMRKERASHDTCSCSGLWRAGSLLDAETEEPMAEAESFLARWARRKSEERHSAEAKGDLISEPTNAAPPVTEADLAALGANSDYARFLAKDVPGDLRLRALRALWSSDPSLSQCDGLIDYAGDYTSEQADLTIETLAFRIGQGLLSEDEARLWAALGRPKDGDKTG